MNWWGLTRLGVSCILLGFSQFFLWVFLGLGLTVHNTGGLGIFLGAWIMDYYLLFFFDSAADRSDS